MIKKRHRSTAFVFLVADLVALIFAFLAAWYVRFELEMPALTKGVPEREPYFVLFGITIFLWPLVFYFHGLYQRRRDRSRIDEALTVTLAVFVGTFLISALQAWYRPTPVPGEDPFTFSRYFVAIFAALDIAAMVFARNVARTVLQEMRIRGLNLQRILIVGAGALGKEIAYKLQAHRELGFEVVGFVDDDPGKASRSFMEAPVLGTLNEVGDLIQEHEVDQVYIALPIDAHRKMIRVMNDVGRECVEVKLVPDVLQYATLKATLEDVDGLPVINLSQVPLQGWNSLAKRLMDVACASAALAALLPFFPFLALLIWLEDRGPIFYKQTRMGLDGRQFKILKFRSMRVNAEATTGPVWATKNDDRRTRLGEFMRRTSIDELPQIWNVLKGEMSIVGPRPERPSFVNEFKHKIPDYMLRHRVKAGITGWAQVHGWRGNTSIRKRIQYDIYYIQNWSLLLDLKIVWMTLRSGAFVNAY